MRDMTIQFLSEGNQDKKIEEGRNYFFEEANQLVKTLKKEYNKRSFTKKIVVYFPNLDINFTKIMNLAEVEDFKFFVSSMVDARVDKSLLNKVFYEETKLLNEPEYASETFRAFMTRYDHLLCTSQQKPFPFLISLSKMYGLYQSAFDTYGHLFYSNLEKTVRAVESLFHATLAILRNDNPEMTKKELQQAFFRFVNDKEDFEKMRLYISSHLQSLSYRQIGALYPKYLKYQLIEQVLFEKLPYYISFDESLRLHEKMIEDFYFVFHLDLFNGGKFLENYDFEKKVFNPVIEHNAFLVEQKIKRLIDEQGYDEEEVNEILNIYKYRADAG